MIWLLLITVYGFELANSQATFLRTKYPELFAPVKSRLFKSDIDTEQDNGSFIMPTF